MVTFMFRNSRKQKADREKLQSKVVTGAPIMTTSGIFGTIISMNEDENEVVIETTPGTKIRLHRQAVASVVEPKVETTTAAPAAKAPAKSAAKAPAKSAAKPAAKTARTK
jgi:preprotein translocase subunit YajC